MTTTGFDAQRAEVHDTELGAVIAGLSTRGYRPIKLSLDGDSPDLKIRDRDGRTAYVDYKVGDPNLTIKLGSLETYWRLTQSGNRVYIVAKYPDGAFVDTPHTLESRIIGGPRRRSGNGSQTDWVLVKRGGTPFDEFFLSCDSVAA